MMEVLSCSQRQDDLAGDFCIDDIVREVLGALSSDEENGSDGRLEFGVEETISFWTTFGERF